MSAVGRRGAATGSTDSTGLADVAGRAGLAGFEDGAGWSSSGTLQLLRVAGLWGRRDGGLYGWETTRAGANEMRRASLCAMATTVARACQFIEAPRLIQQWRPGHARREADQRRPLLLQMGGEVDLHVVAQGARDGAALLRLVG